MTQSPTLNVLVVDDEPPAQRRLTDLLDGRDDVSQVDVCDNGRDAVDTIRTTDLDVVFLDVQMPDCTGIEVVNKVGAEHMPIVIFVTAYDQHALKAFELAALDYLLKPFEDERFHEALDRAAHQVEMRSADQLEHQLERLLDVSRADASEDDSTYLKRIPVRTRNEVRIVAVDDIMYCEADGPYVRLHLHSKDTYLIRERMKVLEERLNPEQFCRIHRSTIVNLDDVEAVLPNHDDRYMVRLASGKRLRVSRGRRDAFEERFGLAT